MKATVAWNENVFCPVPCSISVLTIVVQQPKGQSWHPEAPSMSRFICLSVWTLASACCGWALCWSSNIISIWFPPPHVGDLAFQFSEYTEHFSGEAVASSIKSSTLEFKEFVVRSGWREASSLQGTQAVIRKQKLPLFSCLAWLSG